MPKNELKHNALGICAHAYDVNSRSGSGGYHLPPKPIL